MRTFLIAAAILSCVATVRSAEYPVPLEHDVRLDVRFASGQTMSDVRLHYATIGTLRRDERGTAVNAVLILHGTGGSSRQFLNDRFAGVLFSKGGLLDASRYFIILPDNIGHGRSSKPSDGERVRFPRYTYDDMVVLQHRVVTEALGIDHLFLVMGTSMGGMHTWLWGEKYPDMMDGLVPLASVPAEIAGRNRVWRKMVIDLIRGDPAWNGGDYSAQPPALVPALEILMIATSSPLQWQKSGPTRDDADRWLAEQLTTRLAATDANDLLYALEASRDYDPSARLGEIRAQLLAINSADDFVNPPELHILETQIRRVPKGKAIVIPTSEQTHGHGTHTWAAVWEGELRKFLRTVR